MNALSNPFAAVIESRVQSVAHGCTRCGKCFEFCHMPAPAAQQRGQELRGCVRYLRRF